MKDRRQIFNKVLAACPDRKAKGGIAAVAASYSKCFPGMRFVETNSRHGFLQGQLKLALAMVKLPWLRLNGAKILHVHSASGKSFIRKTAVMAWARLLGYKIVFHSHSGLLKGYAEKVGKHKVAKIVGKANHVVVLSPVWEKYFLTDMNCSKVSVVNNIVEEPQTPQIPSPDGKVRFLFLGILVERKGIFDLLEAVKIVARRCPDRFSLTVGGGQGEEERFKKLIAGEDLNTYVEYAGWLEGQQKEEALAKADVIILPSYAEGTPICILEGFVRHLPAISCAVGGVPDLVESGINGILTQPGDINAIAEAMTEYINKPDIRKSHGEAGYRTAQQFLPDSVADSLERIYTEILDKS